MSACRSSPSAPYPRSVVRFGWLLAAPRARLGRAPGEGDIEQRAVEGAQERQQPEQRRLGPVRRQQARDQLARGGRQQQCDDERNEERTPVRHALNWRRAVEPDEGDGGDEDDGGDD